MFRIVFSALLLFLSLAFFFTILDHPTEGVHNVPLILLPLIYLFIGSILLRRVFGENSISNFTVYFNLIIVSGLTIAFGRFEKVISNGVIYPADDHYLLLAVSSFFLWLALFLNKGRTNNVFNDGVDHITGILHKSNDQRYRRDLEQLANSSPEGKKAVESLLKQQEELNRQFEEIQKSYDK